MRISKEKIQALKHRAARAGKAAVGGSKSTVYEGAAGAIAAYAGKMLDDKVQFAGQKPWVKGAALVIGGHLLKKRRSMASVGAALCGAGGYALGLYMQNRSASAAVAPAAPATAPSQTSGIYDASAYNDTSDTGLVFTSAASNVRAA